ncbi:unnamed protein product [Psylliodes chrysocephalus]|uniref:Guanylate cyclase n=1 Tax=Psylliodes chrysocephalus TaxID=3402493 RepID=A0A9P0CHL5_9CUCU|nr:unnamed protein product [Psylliodes chrysocephala]
MRLGLASLLVVSLGILVRTPSTYAIATRTTQDDPLVSQSNSSLTTSFRPLPLDPLHSSNNLVEGRAHIEDNHASVHENHPYSLSNLHLTRNSPPEEEINGNNIDGVIDEVTDNSVAKEGLLVGDLKKTDEFKRTILNVGYLAAVKGQMNGRQGLAISGAIKMALDEVNNDPNLLPNITLDLKYYDTKGETVLATKAMTELICEGVSAFFGPEGSCHVEAIISQARNIPMISYKCSDYKASDVPTFARTEPTDTQVTKSVISLLTYYKWKKFSIIYDYHYSTVANSLKKEALQRNMTINFVKEAMDTHSCCQNNLPCCQDVNWYNIIKDTKNKTRIYVFMGTAKALVELMDAMETAKLFEKGEYFLIYVESNTYSDEYAYQYLWIPETLTKYNNCKATGDFSSAQKRAKSLFVVAPTAPTENYSEFTTKVQEYNLNPPFNFPPKSKNLPPSFEKFVTIYAAYLFDSVKLYASALHYLLSQKSFLNETVIREIASDGTKIIETIIQINGTYKSITGAMMKLDKNGDSEGNYSVIAYSVPKDKNVRDNFTCDYQMRPVGQFYQSSEPNNTIPRYELNSNTQIYWPDGTNRPKDQPSCGFDNELCPKPNTQLNSIIAAGVLAIMLFCFGVITMSIYRKWKIEQEIEGLLWKINRDEIHNYFEGDVVASPSKLSLASASVTSYESRGGLQVFATTAQYRGVVVRIKELNFSRKKDISRDIMKEMRLLRELRHDNVNSFIGACVQPTSILLVTDYCAKGSLYDIVENEDIKLDKMFIASLVHDLIKGMLYIHNSMLMCHGNLKSSNCVVTSRWVLQVTDFGLAEMRHCAENDSIGEYQYYTSLLWKAPEILRNPCAHRQGTQKADVYSFAIILYEILGRRGPFGVTKYEPKDIIENVKKEAQYDPFRPDIDALYDSELGCDEYVLQCMKDCWSENPDDRPDFVTVRTRLKRMKDGKNKNIMDQMMDMMVKYANNLEELVTERTRLLDEEKQKTEDLLHRMLPQPVAQKLTKGMGVEPESFDQVTIYFSDIVGFTAMSAESTPLQVVNFLNDLYTVFDSIIKGYDVYKVETIGDAYMVVSGLPIKNENKHAGEIASMSLELLNAVKSHSISHRPNEPLKLRVGVHTGPVVAGVVGLTMPRYCLFGDTVNTASRMESNGEPLKIHISQQCKDALDKLGGYIIEERGIVSLKGKGDVKTYWLTGATEQAIQKREVDLGELPPLFCRPRRSPKLTSDSRNASVTGFGGFHSRRHSSVPRGTSTEVESTSTIQNSPVPAQTQRLTRHTLTVPDSGGSKLTINTAFGSQLIEVPEENRKPRPRRVLSSIASSCDEHQRSQGMLNRIRESKSLDPLPFFKGNKPSELMERFLNGERKSTRSLESCEKCGEIQIIALPEDKMTNNNFPNGNLFPQENVHHYMEDVQAPLLNAVQQNIASIRRRGGSAVDDLPESEFSKKWRSLEAVSTSCGQLSDVPSKKSVSKSALKSWLVSLFSGSGFKSSSTSLRKGNLNEYNNLQVEKESIV